MLFIQELVLENKRNFGGSSQEKILAYFEKVIIHFEKLEFEYFIKNHFELVKRNSQVKKPILRKRFSFNMLYDKNNRVFNKYYQSKIYHYWRVKLQFLDRPLLRCFWKIVHMPFHGFGFQPLNKSPFEPRPVKKKKIRLKSRFARGRLMLPKLQELQKESTQLLEIVKMVKLREELKLQEVLITYFPEKSGEREKVIDKVRDVLASDDYKEEGMEKDVYSEEDLMMYCCNLVEGLDKIDMNLEDFRSESYDRRMKDLYKCRNEEMKQVIQRNIKYKSGNHYFIYFMNHKTCRLINRFTKTTVEK